MYVFNIKIQNYVLLHSKSLLTTVRNSTRQAPSAAAVRLGLLQSQGISPMNFPVCLQGQWRPKLNERQGASKIKRKAAVLDEDESTQTSLISAPKKTGHPIVIKNKENEQVSVSQPTRSQPERPERVGSRTNTDSSFLWLWRYLLGMQLCLQRPYKREKFITEFRVYLTFHLFQF